MTRNTSRLAGAERKAALTITASLFLCSAVLAQKSASGSAPGSTGSSVEAPKLGIQNKLIFPYGIQNFERMKAGTGVEAIPGWQMIGSNATIAVAQETTGVPRQGTLSKRWMCVQDNGSVAGEGFFTAPIVSPDPWDYAWTFDLRVGQPPAGSSDWPVIAVQHDTNLGYQDAWGIELTSSGANLFLTSIWGVPDSQPIPLPYGQWTRVRVVASLETNRLEAFVDGVSVMRLGMLPRAGTSVERQRLAYHGQGAGNSAVVDLDDVGVAFLSGVCKEDLVVDFESTEDGAALVNGQAIAGPIGDHVSIFGFGPNAGAAIFDTDTAGPNNPSQDPDLLVDTGNALILQTDGNPTQTVGGIFDRPNDDEDGGTISFAFSRPLQLLAIDLIDIDNQSDEGSTITLIDFMGRTRVYFVPINWTGDIDADGPPGKGTLDLTALAPQAGFMGTMTSAVEDAGFNGMGIVAMDVTHNSSAGIDNLIGCIPCVELTFDTEDDGNPDTAGTPLVNGQDISTPDEFGIETSVASLGPNAGAAIFDSTPGGPNDPGPDNDLLVGLGNILILQNDLFATQSVSGIFDTPNDDTNGGDIVFTFPGPVFCHRVDLIDVDEEEVTGVTVVLEDSDGDTRTFTVPPAWTEDRLNDGPPGFRTLDLTTLLPQPGFAAVATAVEDPGFDPDEVVMMTVTFGGAQAMDNFCFCP
jgi:hypothetical protein